MSKVKIARLWPRLNSSFRRRKKIKILEIRRSFVDIFQIAIRCVVEVEVEVSAIGLFTREQEGDGYNKLVRW